MNSYIEDWKSRMSGRSLTPGDIEELAQHLEEKMAELAARGFSEEEAWTVAAKELGDDHQLEAEFEKVTGQNRQNQYLIGYGILMLFQLILLLSIKLLAVFNMESVAILNLTSWNYSFMILVISLPALPLFLKRDEYSFAAFLKRVLFSHTWSFYGKVLAGAAIAIVFSTFIGFVSLETDHCANSISQFDRSLPLAQRYKKELARQLTANGTDNVLYYFKSYRQISGKEYIVLAVKGKTICADAWLEVDGLLPGNIHRVSGKGYSGAQMTGVKIDIKNDASGTRLIYKSARDLID